MATQGADSRPFRASASVDDVIEGGAPAVVGCELKNGAVQSDGDVILDVRLSVWLDQVDFALVPASTDGNKVLLARDQNPHKAFVRGLKKPRRTRSVRSSASSEDATLMRNGGYSVYIAGNATKESITKTFGWGFTNSTRYDDCVFEVEGKENRGVSITSGGTESVQLTIHGDHFFYDDLASQEAVIRFNGIAAADADSDGEVTLDELGRVKLVDVAEGTYGTGSASNVNELEAFVQALTVTIGHFRGEGHCAEYAR